MNLWFPGGSVGEEGLSGYLRRHVSTTIFHMDNQKRSTV